MATTVDGERTLISPDPETTSRLGEALGAVAEAGDLLCLWGELGAGKTHLAKAIGRGLGVDATITSPSFILMAEYEGRLPLFHIDLYRLDHVDQLEDVDYFGTLEADGVTCVEWGDRFLEAAPFEYVAVAIEITADDERDITIGGVGPRGESLAGMWGTAAAGLAGVEVRS